ncbi:centriole, cilia and spindle-associated protein [Osmerus mordax]|uniref:centriole, cilia and spindle-associated protein n=1 Tax=Osmerus mordax TaxID=8014 RepID=UPI00350EE480
MVTKIIRTEYMKKFRDPKWETFSKYYEDSLKYRLTRRVMEHAHKPWVWEGWDSGSDSSGRSTPNMKNKVAPINVTSTPLELKKERSSVPKDAPERELNFENDQMELNTTYTDVLDNLPNSEPVIENGLTESDEGTGKEVLLSSSLSDETQTDNRPLDNGSSDEETVRMQPKRCHRLRTPLSEPGYRDSLHDDKQIPVQKTIRAKSQPPTSKENKQCLSQADWTGRHMASVRKTPNEGRMSDASIQTRRESDKQGSNLDRRRARSADLEKMQRSELTVAEDRWMTEYMRCFSARLR